MNGALQDRPVSSGDEGYCKALKPRQVQMMAIGGTIGTGLFLGAGGRLATAGPGLFLVYAICGAFVFLMLRALGELVLYRPSSGSVVSYAREFFGEKAAFVAGWMYFLFWAMSAVVETTAIATYFRYWRLFDAAPQWLLALVALTAVLGVNLVSVRRFGEFEFWAALVKVLAVVVFLIVGTVFLAGRFRIQGHSTGLDVITGTDGILPTGALPLIMVTSGVLCAYSGVELIGTIAGETENPAEVMPRAINRVIARIALFYVGSLLLFGLLLPYTAYAAGVSPFVTFFSTLGVGGSATAVNVVVLTAAFSSLNAGLYGTGRILRTMAVTGSAPLFAARISTTGVPYGGVLLTGSVALVGVALNAIAPGKAFEIALNMATLGILTAWAMIVACQIQLWRRARAGKVERPAYRLPGTPYTGLATLAFLAAVPVLMACSDDDVQQWTVATLLLIAPALMVGWYLTRKNLPVQVAQADSANASAKTPGDPSRR
nr:amino acid permease [Nocardia pneumoniae]